MKLKNCAAGAALTVVALTVFCALFAGWIAPYSPQEETRGHSYHPPSKIHFRDTAGNWTLRPFVYAARAGYDENLKRVYEEDRSRKFYLTFSSSKLISAEGAGRLYLLGTDSRGRDLFSRILYGARISLSLAILGALLSGFAGLIMGSISGYFGGRLDLVLMRSAEFFIMIPGLYLLLALRGALPPDLDSRQVYGLIVAVLSLIGWGSSARVIRGLVLSIREKDFVRAAKVLGRPDREILMRHIIPHTFPYLAVVVSVAVPGFIIGESALSVLGLGIQEPAVSWGNLLSESMPMAHLSLHPWVAAPAFLIILTAMCFNRLGDVFARRNES